MANWVQISEEQAKKHPLYGNKGWALVLGIFLILGLASGLGNYTKISKLDGAIDGVEDQQIAMGIHLILFAICIILYLIKNSGFRDIFTFTQVLFVSFHLYSSQKISGFSLLSDELIVDTIATTIVNLVWILYIWKSERINVTCQNRVRDNDPFLNQIDLTSNAPSYAKCSKCRGTGEIGLYLDKKACQNCGGTGRITVRKHSDKKIDKSVPSSSPLRESKSSSDTIKERLEAVKDLEDQGLIDAEQAKKKRDAILGEL